MIEKRIDADGKIRSVSKVLNAQQERTIRDGNHQNPIMREELVISQT
jgi:hypothetical protein